MASSNNDNDRETTKKDPFCYLTGFGNEFESEYLPGALPVGRNNPKSVPYGLYTEQLSGTAFTAPRAHNRRTWLYRLQPSVVLQDASEASDATEPKQFFGGTNPADCTPPTNPMRWKPNHDSENHHAATRDFVDGVQLLCTTPGGTPMTKSGLSIYLYSANASMQSKALCNADGDFLVVPTEGILTIHTEMGRLQVQPREMCVLPRGMVFAIHVAEREQQETSTFSRGYLLEVYQAGDGFRLPDLGLIGANGLANPRDFFSPTAWCPARHDLEQPCTIFFKMNGLLHKRVQDHSPFNVMAWHGNYVPYKYDLGRFCPMNAVSYDHADPSIFTVLTCPSGTAAPGTALVDVVVFPPRVQATDPNTLRPPWFHRNVMSEFMGLIAGTYDAKQDFCAGGASLHNCMTPHGPDAATYQAAVAHPCDTPTRLDGGYAFMFETYLPLAVAPSGYTASGPLWKRDVDYTECWTKQQGGLSVTFTGWDLLAKQKQQERDE